SVGSGGSSSGNTGRIMIRLKPRAERVSADEVIQKLKPRVSQVPGIKMFMQIPPPVRIGGKLTKSQYQFTLQSPATEDLYRYSGIFEERMKTLTQLQDVTSDLQIKNPQVNVEIKRDQAAAMGVTAEQIEDALYTAYGSRQVSTIYAPNDQYSVIMELEDQY
ncbi:MAG: efflux RND transporter permease subunit, partial [Thermodesulfovibrionales bacterium]